MAAAGGYGPGQPSYRYPWPPPAWDELNLEQQASLVEHAFAARGPFHRSKTPKGASPTRYAGLTPFGNLD